MSTAEVHRMVTTRWLRHGLAARFPYDVFVSYGTADAALYAGRIEQRLRALGFKVFLDRREVPADSPFETILKRGLKRSTSMVLIASEAAYASRWVLWEVESYQEVTGRPIIVVSPNEPPHDAALARKLVGLAFARETPEALAAGEPSPVIDEHVRAVLSFGARGRHFRRLALAVAAVIMVLALLACFQAVVIWRLKHG